MQLIVISPSENKDHEIQRVNQMLEMGLGTFHLRKPKFSTVQMRNYLRQIPSHFHRRIIIHSHHDLARQFDLKGIHITRLHRKRWFRLWINESLLKLRGKKVQRTASFRKLVSLYEDNVPYDHVFLSPVFDSLSGKIQGGFNEFSLNAALKKTSYQVIARGGMDVTRLEKVHELGFAGLAFYTALWNKSDPVKVFEEILRKGKELNIQFT